MKIIRKIIDINFVLLAALVSVFICCHPSISAQEPDLPPLKAVPFPSWMDQAQGGDAKNGGTEDSAKAFNDPAEPSDPDTKGKINSPQGPQVKSRFTFVRPRLPNFAELRKKSVRTVISNTASGTRQTETIEISRVKNELTRLMQIASDCAALPQGERRNVIEKMLQAENARLTAMQELCSLLASNTSTGGTIDLSSKALEGLSVQKQKRISDLKKIVYPMTPQSLSETPAVIAPPTREEAIVGSATGKIPKQFHRPSFVGSFYRETKNEKSDENTSNNDEGANEP